MTFASTLLPMPAETLALSRYDVACRALAAAKAVDDVMEIVAHADAVRVYARQAKNRQMEIDAAEIRIRAERRLGELMAAQKASRRGSERRRRSEVRPPGWKKTPVICPRSVRRASTRTWHTVPEPMRRSLRRNSRSS